MSKIISPTTKTISANLFWRSAYVFLAPHSRHFQISYSYLRYSNCWIFLHYKFISSIILAMPTRIYIGRLPYRASERDVEKFFNGFGNISEVILKKGFGFVVSLLFFLDF